MVKIDGLEIAAGIAEKLKKQPVPKKFLAVFLVGQNPQSLAFIRQKKEFSERLGVDFRLYEFPETIKNDELRERVRQVVQAKPCGGALVQLPLPPHLNRHYILNVIPREKDIDVLGERALGAFYTGRNPVLPPAVGVVQEIIKARGLTLGVLRAAVVGLGFLIGRPIASYLAAKTPELYLLDKGSDFKILKQADLVILGAGQAGLIRAQELQEGAGVIDFGSSLDENGKIQGDFDSSGNTSHLSFYTPTPGGTGPILVAKLFENFYALNNNG